MIQAIEFLASSNPLGHVIDSNIVEGDPFNMGRGWLFSNVTLMLLVTMVVTILIVVPAAKRIATGGTQGQRKAEHFTPIGAWANFVESICVYLLDEVFKPVLKEHTYKFTPILWTFFWFILVANILGLLPLRDLTETIFHYSGLHGRVALGGTATQSIWVTGTLALIAFLVVNLSGLIKDPVGYVKHLSGGAPVFMWPIMIPVEILGIFVKPFALAMRLFANMTGGHMVIAALMGFVPALIGSLGLIGGGIAIFPILGSVAVNMLEILVAFIQAFVFTFLTCLFIGQVVVHEHHDGDHEPGHGADQHPAGHGH